MTSVVLISTSISDCQSDHAAISVACYVLPNRVAGSGEPYDNRLVV